MGVYYQGQRSGGNVNKAGYLNECIVWGKPGTLFVQRKQEQLLPCQVEDVLLHA